MRNDCAHAHFYDFQSGLQRLAIIMLRETLNDTAPLYTLLFAVRRLVFRGFDMSASDGADRVDLLLFSFLDYFAHWSPHCQYLSHDYQKVDWLQR